MNINKLPIDCTYHMLTFLPIKKQLLMSLTVNNVDFINYNDKKNMNKIFREASRRGYSEVIKKTINNHRIDPSSDDNYAIREASKYGHLKVVKELLKDPRVNPAADDNYAIMRASRNGHTNIVKLLLKDKRVELTGQQFP